jgi:hypothetical protein
VRRAAAAVSDAALDAVKFVVSALRGLAGRILFFAVVGGAFGLVVVAILFASGALAHSSGVWTYARYLLWLVYPLAGALALAWGGAWRGLGDALVDAGVERGFVAYVAEGLVAQAARTIPEHPDAADTDRAHWKAPLRRVLHDYVRDDPSEGASGITGRVLRRLKRFFARSLVKIVLGRAELLPLFAGAVDGSAEAKVQLVSSLERLFTDRVEALVSRPMILALLGLPVAYALVPIVLWLI